MKTFKLRFVAGLMGLALIALAIGSYPPSTRAQTEGEGPRADKTLSPYFFVQGDPTVDRLPLKDTKVEISISGVIADVKVVQTYRNEGSRPINATYVFPESTRAAVYGMRMRIGDRDVDILETQHRRHIPITCSWTFGSARTSAGVPTFWILPTFHTATRWA